MLKTFRIQAEIKIKKEGGRSWPIKTGYRPGFNFLGNHQTSGQINLLKRDDIKPGEQGVVEVDFFSDELLGNIASGSEFRFYEGPTEIGVGKVLNVIGWVENIDQED